MVTMAQKKLEEVGERVGDTMPRERLHGTLPCGQVQESTIRGKSEKSGHRGHALYKDGPEMPWPLVVHSSLTRVCMIHSMYTL